MDAWNRSVVRLDHATWPEVEAYLEHSAAIILPTGSTEQHGPMGLIGTDALCSEAIAEAAADIANVLVAPTLAYTPAPFNTAFPGTVSVSAALFGALFGEIVSQFRQQGFRHIYVLNGHGANLDPLEAVAHSGTQQDIRIRNWWDFASVQRLRDDLYGDWEGMHATPSEVSMTQAMVRVVSEDMAREPPKKLSASYVAAHARDRHGDPRTHRARFPDGRVGSHSALARPEHGADLLKVASRAVAQDVLEFAAA